MRSERIAELFASALEREAEERETYLAAAAADAPELRAEVLRLLAAHWRAGDFLAAPLDPDQAAALFDRDEGLEAGRKIGPYRLVHEVGRGGMGTVYLAERDDGSFEQRVALKLIKRGMDSEAILRRFLHERQILARLEHPRIARLYDGGLAADDRPYFAMEYVDGLSITRFCAEHRLDVEARLRLFQDICRAVQHAHANLVVHRDLKPSNVLVTAEGEVKLLDFGIARLLDEDGEAGATALTRTGLWAMTPDYAAPEQVVGAAVTTATDVYGLGLVLYELLTGHRPYRVEGRTPEAVARALSEAEPPRPSTVVGRTLEVRHGDGTNETVTPEAVARERRTTPERLRRWLAGDLDRVVLKALAKQPERRYPSAEALLEDIGRHLEGLPVRARPATLAYRAAKFVRRHGVGVAMASLVAASLALGLAGTAWQARAAGRERDAARAEAAKAQQVAEFLAEVFRLSDPLVSKGEEVTVREALDRGAERIYADLAGQPVVQAELMSVLGRTYLELGALDRANELLTAALEVRREHLGPQHRDVAESLRYVGLLLYQQGDYRRSETSYLEAVAILERSQEPDLLELAATLNNLGILYRRTGQYDKGVAAAERALAIRERQLGPDALDVGKAALNLGTLYSNMREDRLALAAYERALAIYERELGSDHPMVAGTLGNIGLVRMRQGEYDGLEPVLRRVLSIHRKAYGPVHDNVGTALNTLGELLGKMGRADEAVAVFLEAAEVYGQALGEDHAYVAHPLQKLGDLYLSQGRPQEALAVFHRAATIREAAFGQEHPLLASSLEGLGRAQAAIGDLERAEASLYRALAIRRRVEGPQRDRIAASGVLLSEILIDRGRCEQAVPLLTEIAATIERDATAGDGLTAVDAQLARCDG